MAKELKVNTKTKITTLEDAQRAIKELQEVLNKLIEKVDSPAEQELKESDGDSGDIQITQNVDKSYNFSVRTEEGWKTPVIGNTAIAFKDKPKVDPKANKKSIEEIESEDTTTEASDAKKTIYDEKNDKFVIPRPDFDTGWFAWDHSAFEQDSDNPLTFTHNLGAIPVTFSIWFAGVTLHNGTAYSGTANPALAVSHGESVESSIINWAIPMHGTGGYSHDFGIFIGCEKNDMKVMGGQDYTSKTSSFGTPGEWANYDDGYARILLWK